MRRPVWASFGLLLAIAAVSSGAWAVERELAGVRLGDKAMDLLSRPGFGQPGYIGPIGTVSLPSPEQPAGAGRAGGRSGPAGPTRGGRQGGAGMGGGAMRGGGMRAGGGMGGGMRGGGMRGGMRGAVIQGTVGLAAAESSARATAALPPAASLELGLTGGMRGGGMGGGMRGGGMRGGGMGGGMRGGGMRGGGMGGGMRGGGGGARGGGAARRGAGGRAGRAGTAGVGGRGAGGQARGGGAGGMYWYYRRPGGAALVLSLTPTGEVKTITLSGMLPYAAGQTSRSIGLASTYMDVISRYGYPDQTVTIGNGIELTYVDHGVRFTLEGMRVTRIAIGAEVVGGVEAAPAVTPEAGPPPVGLTPEELRGYL